MKNFLMLFLRESNGIENVYDELSLTYARAAWDCLVKQKKLTTQNILKTHSILMHGKLPEKEIGAWRKDKVWIGGREARPWYTIPQLMDNWIKWSEEPDLTEDEIKTLHVKFEVIHPFIDGNGRMGRILMNWQRVKVGLPILVIREADKQSYYSWFN